LKREHENETKAGSAAEKHGKNAQCVLEQNGWTTPVTTLTKRPNKNAYQSNLTCFYTGWS